MPPALFEPAVPASKRPQTHALDGPGTVTAREDNTKMYFKKMVVEGVNLT